MVPYTPLSPDHSSVRNTAHSSVRNTDHSSVWNTAHSSVRNTAQSWFQFASPQSGHCTTGGGPDPYLHVYDDSYSKSLSAEDLRVLFDEGFCRWPGCGLKVNSNESLIRYSSHTHCTYSTCIYICMYVSLHCWREGMCVYLCCGVPNSLCRQTATIAC